NEREWVFDFLLSVFRSPQWDAAVMGFIDENCTVFDNDEENKLNYTSLHEQFKDLVEALCSSSLAEVGVAVQDFVDALDASRLNHKISTAVYEQLMAMNDFVTFKKLMVKRNTELELEAVHALQDEGVPISTLSKDDQAQEGGEMRIKSGDLKDEDEIGAAGGPGGTQLDQQLRDAMDANLQELELMHKRVSVCPGCTVS
ncbi:unnamed protein product, partial [Discosporangium mesarthrocarpum]